MKVITEKTENGSSQHNAKERDRTAVGHHIRESNRNCRNRSNAGGEAIENIDDV